MSIPYNQLRIGSVCLISKDIVTAPQVYREAIFALYEIHLYRLGHARVLPIPITERLLIERCGMNAMNFKPTDKFNPEDVKVFGNADGVIIQRVFFPNGGFVFHYKEMKVMLKGLHHLQNLINDIFDTELIIK